MTVYLTKSMLSKLNKIKYPISVKEDEGSSSSDPWQKMFNQRFVALVAI